jgi:hypothetical protein
MAGAFIANVQSLPTSPASGATNTATTVTVQGKNLDPFMRLGAAQFQVDRIATFATPDLQTSSNVTVQGWAATPAQWVSATIGNGTWVYRVRSTLVRVGGGPGVTGRYSTPVEFTQSGGALVRGLYLYVNRSVATGVPITGSNGRSLYLYVNHSVFVYVASRSLYLYRNARDGEVSPWLNHINPTEQYILGQVDLYGDGFGQYLEVAAGATITVDSVNGGYVAENAVDRSNGSWVSNNNRANAWIRFTFPSTKRIVGVALEGAGNNWGVPRFVFSSGADIDGVVAVPGGADNSPEYPCGGTRRLYWFPSTPRDTTFVEIRGPAGDGTTFIGLYEVWIIEEVVPAQNAETSRAALNLGFPFETTMGIVAWQNRSPNFWPANSGVPPLPAATVTVSVDSESGLMYVEEST